MAEKNFSEDLLGIIEALIFSSPEPLTVEKIHDVLVNFYMDIKKHDVKESIEKLLEEWSSKERNLGKGMTLKKIAGGYLFVTDEAYSHIVQKMIGQKPIKITKAQIEVLAIIAYRQPIIRVDIDEIRGVDSSFAIKRLIELNLVKILGKSEGLGRPLLYGTTRHFLEFFGLNSLNDLPNLREYESADELGSFNFNANQNQVNIADLFDSAKENPMFSDKTEKFSQEALKSLDEALLNASSLSSEDFLEEEV